MSNEELSIPSSSVISEELHSAESSQEQKPIDSPVEVENDGRRLFIGSLDKNATEDDLKELFSDFKDFKIELSKPRFFRKSKPFTNNGFAFAEFETKEDASKAMETKDKSIVGTKNIYIKLATAANSKDNEEKSESHKKSIKKEKAKKDSKDTIDPDAKHTPESSVPVSTTTSAKSKKVKRESNYSLPPYNVYVKNVPSLATPKLFLDLFSEFEPKWARINKTIIYSRKEGKEMEKHPGTAFVGFSDKASRDGCVERFNQIELEGVALEVNPSGRAEFKYFEAAQAETPQSTEEDHEKPSKANNE